MTDIWEDYESGPFCVHWSELGDCDEVCYGASSGRLGIGGGLSDQTAEAERLECCSGASSAADGAGDGPIRSDDRRGAQALATRQRLHPVPQFRFESPG